MKKIFCFLALVTVIGCSSETNPVSMPDTKIVSFYMNIGIWDTVQVLQNGLILTVKTQSDTIFCGTDSISFMGIRRIYPCYPHICDNWWVECKDLGTYSPNDIRTITLNP